MSPGLLGHPRWQGQRHPGPWAAPGDTELGTVPMKGAGHGASPHGWSQSIRKLLGMKLILWVGKLRHSRSRDMRRVCLG